MPAVHVTFDATLTKGISRGDDVTEVFDDFYDMLTAECARRFSLDERPLASTDFSVYGQQLDMFDGQQQDIIVRITLHHDAERVRHGDRHAAELMQIIENHCNRDELLSRRGGPMTVGVSLLFAEIAWAETES